MAEETEHTDSLEDKMLASVEKLQPDSATDTKEVKADPKKEEKKEEKKEPASQIDDSAPVKHKDTPDEDESDEEEKDEDDSKPDDEAEEDEPEEETDDEELDPDFTKAASKYDIPISLDDVLAKIPKEARAEARTFIAQKIKGMDAGYTKAMQEARSYRKEKAQYDQEKSYREAAPDQWLADYIQQNPSVIDKVNAELEKRADPTYAEAHAKTRAAEKKEAELAQEKQEIEERNQADAERRTDERIEHVTTYVEKSAKSNGVPVELVEEAIAAHIMQSEDNDITDAEIDQIITAKAKVLNRLTGAAKGAKTKEYAKDKARDAKDLPLKPRSSSSPENTQAKKPANLEEAINWSLDKIEKSA